MQQGLCHSAGRLQQAGGAPACRRCAAPAVWSQRRLLAASQRQRQRAYALPPERDAVIDLLPGGGCSNKHAAVTATSSSAGAHVGQPQLVHACVQRVLARQRHSCHSPSACSTWIMSYGRSWTCAQTRSWRWCTTVCTTAVHSARCAALCAAHQPVHCLRGHLSVACTPMTAGGQESCHRE